MSSWIRSGLLVATLAALAPQAQADIYDDAWDCASAVVDTVEVGFTMGPKALKFVATQPSCVVRLGTPATAAPIGVVVGLANTGVLPASQPQCSAKLYDTAAQPLAAALSASLGELGVLPDDAVGQLADIAAGEMAGELLTQVPGMTEVAGSLTCGCELVEAGLSIESIERVLETGDQLGNACGGVVWDTAKEVAGEVVDFAGDAAEEGIRQVSNLGDKLAGQTQHMPYHQYFDQHWLPRVEDFAAMEYSNPGNWHDQQQWRQMWEPCVSYFDGHTQSAETARYTCDNMRSGGPLFPDRNFGRLMFRRLFDFDVADAVKAARSGSRADLMALPLEIDLPAEIAEDAEAMQALEDQWQAQRITSLGTAVDRLFGVPQRESMHDGLKVHASTPPALFEHGTVGARAQDYFSEVDANQSRADAARAVELAMADMDLTARFTDEARGIKRAFYLDRYQFVLTMREHLKDKDREKAENWAQQCPTQACRDQIRADYDACRNDVQAWYDANAALIGDFDTPRGQQAGREWSDRTAACLAQAKQTAQDNRWHVKDSAIDGMDGPGMINTPRDGIGESRVGPQVDETAAGRRGRGSRDAQSDTGARESSADRGRLDGESLLDALRGESRPARDPRADYRDRATRGETSEAADDAAPSDPDAERLQARRASRDAYRLRDAAEPAAREVVMSEPSAESEVSGLDLPGCAAVRGMMRPRMYACGSDEAYEGCRRTVQGRTDVQCQRARR